MSKKQRNTTSQAPSAQKRKRPAFYDDSRFLHKAMPYILILSAVAFGICLAANLMNTSGGLLGNFLVHGIGGILSLGVYILPILLALHGLFWKRDVQNRRIWTRVICSFVFLAAVCALTQALTMPLDSLRFSAVDFIQNGQAMKGGGLLGGVVAYGLYKLVGGVCFFIVLFLIVALYACTYIDFKKIKAAKEKKNSALPKKQKMSLGARIRLLRQARADRDGYYGYGKENDSFESMRRQIEKEVKRKVPSPAGAPSPEEMPEPTETPMQAPTSAPVPKKRHRFFFNDDTGTSTPIEEPSVAEKKKEIIISAPPSPTSAPTSTATPSPAPVIKTHEMPKQEQKSKPLPPHVEEIKPLQKLFGRAPEKPKYHFSLLLPRMRSL